MSYDKRNDIVYETCVILVRHFRNLIKGGRRGFHSRIFSYMLHPEDEFVNAGRSVKATTETPTHPEHVVPCAVLISESCRLIEEGALSDEEIASLLQKHWKIATIAKFEQEYLDSELKYKSVMPSGWTFENGDTFARLDEAGISLALA